MARIVKTIGIAMLITLALSACGRKSDLMKPVAETDDGQDHSMDRRAPSKPQSNDPFILDPLVK